MKNKKIISAAIISLFIISMSFVVVLNVSASPGELHVPVNYPTIQAAINAAIPGDTIIVHEGTYDEQVVIDKSLTIQGFGDTTIIKPSSADKLTTVLDGLFWYGTPNTKQIAGIIVANVPSGASVTIKNLRVDESGVTTKPTGADYLTGIFYRETGGTIDTVNIVGTGAWSGSDRAYGIYLSAATNTVSVEIKGCTITNFDKNGIEAMGDKLTANIHHNTITGRGPISDEVQNGINVGRDAVGTVNYNTISNLVYQPEIWWATAILFYHVVSPTGKSATAIGNTITDSQMGIYFFDCNGLAQDNIVSGGTVGLQGLCAEYDAGTWTVIFKNNTVSGARDSDGYENSAIGVATYDTGASLTVNIEGNQLIGGGLTDADGIRIGDISAVGIITATINNNFITGWQHGINLVSSVASATITGNTIQNNIAVDSGIHIEAAVTATNVHVNFNNIYDNSDTDSYGVSNSGIGTLDAENNWWGDITGPYHPTLNPSGLGDEVSDNVDFYPWLIAPFEVIYKYSNTAQATSGSGTTAFIASGSATLYEGTKVGTVTVSISTSGISYGERLVIRYYINPANPGLYIQKTVASYSNTAGWTDTAAAWKVEIYYTRRYGTDVVNWAYSIIYPP